MSDFSDEAGQVSKNQSDPELGVDTSNHQPGQDPAGDGVASAESAGEAAPSGGLPSEAIQARGDPSSPSGQDLAAGIPSAQAFEERGSQAAPEGVTGGPASAGGDSGQQGQNATGQGTYGTQTSFGPTAAIPVPMPVDAGAQPLGKKRNPFGVLLLSIITFGIYGLYWYGKINSEIRRHDPRIHVSPGLAVLAQFIPIVNLVSGYNTAERVKRLEMADRMPSQISPVVSVLFVIFFWIGYPIQVQSHLNAQWDHHLMGLSTS
jgi:hypothetical protein